MDYVQDSGEVRLANYEEECLLTDMKTSYVAEAPGGGGVHRVFTPGGGGDRGGLRVV